MVYELIEMIYVLCYLIQKDCHCKVSNDACVKCLISNDNDMLLDLPSILSDCRLL